MKFRKNDKGRLVYSGQPLDVTPNVVALARTVDATVSATTEITFHAQTTFISVWAKTQAVYMKWGTDDVTASNFDEVIPAGVVMNFIVPDGISAANFIEEAASAKLVVIEK